jgi:hypothetical protein
MRDTNEIHSSRPSASSLSSPCSRSAEAGRSQRSRLSCLASYALPALAAGAVLLGSPRAAHAEDVKPDGKGIVGGAFLGAEVVVFAEALFGVRSGTAYVIGAGGGAIAGAAGGYAIEKAVTDGHIPAYMLAGGLALIIPALVITLDQTRYLPAENAREDRPVSNLPPSDPGKPGGSAVVGVEPAPTAPAPAPAPAPSPAPSGGGGTPAPLRSPQSLINLRLLEQSAQGGFYVGVPVPEVRPVFSAAQKKEFAVSSSGSELRFPVVRVTF